MLFAGNWKPLAFQEGLCCME